MFPLRFQRSTALFLTAAFLPLVLNGCLTVGFDRLESRSTSASAAIEVRVYDRPRDRKTDTTTQRKISTEIVRKDTREKVFESNEGRWTKDGLAPGKYVLRLTRIADESGIAQPIASPTEKTFQIRSGETVRAEIVLKDTSRAVWTTVGVVGGIAVVGLVVSAVRGLGNIRLKGHLRSDSYWPFPNPAYNDIHPEMEIER